MKTFDPGFAAHIATGATTLATCWRLIRADGVTLGFTDHDETLSFDGTDFAPAGGFEGGEETANLGTATNTSDVVGLITSTAITEKDIRLGRYDGATVETWRVNWRDPEERALMRRDSIGEITRQDNHFRAELRSAQEALAASNMRRYQALCNAELGDAKCGVDLDPPAYKTAGTVLELLGETGVRVAGLSAFAGDWFVHGRLAWTSGNRTGLADLVVTQKRFGATDVVYVAQTIADSVAVGDGFNLTAGCNRQFATCTAKFANTVNFRGFPHIPGTDFVLRYPKQGDALSGGAILK